jgi:hypothetical protein
MRVPEKDLLRPGFPYDATRVADRTRAFGRRRWLLLLVVAVIFALFVVPFVLFGIGSTETDTG